jgi:hypothetical protein
MAEPEPKPKPKRARKPRATPPKQPEKIVQPNGSALYSGGVPGNKGGTGRPPNEVRALARELGYRSLGAIEKVLAEIEAKIEAGKPVNTDLLLRIAEHANKFGLGTRDTTEHVFQSLPFVGELASLEEEELDERIAASEGREA